MLVKSVVEVRALDDEIDLRGPNSILERLSIYHQKEWRDLVEATFGHKSLFLAALENGKPIDILPLFVVRSPIFGKKLVSTPYEGCHGGFISRSGSVVAEVIGRAKKQAEEIGAKSIEIRSQRPIPGLEDFGFSEQNPFLISELALEDADDNWQMLSTKHRRNVRIAERKGVRVEIATEIDQMRSFHSLVWQHHHAMGLPFPARVYFDRIWSDLVRNDRALLLLAKMNDEIVGGHLLFLSAGTLISKYAAYRKEEKVRKSYTSYALFWEGIRIGTERGFDTFNMGITGTSNNGLLDFKNRFGCESRPIHFYFLPLRGRAPDYSEFYGGYRLIKKIWSLTPSLVTSPIGQRLSAWFC